MGNTPLTAKVMILPGGSFTYAGTYTLSFADTFINQSNSNCFIGFPADKVTFATGTIREISPEWWGIDGSADDVEINIAIKSLTQGTVLLTKAAYTTSGTINMKTDVHLKGQSGGSGGGTIITYSGTGSAIKFSSVGNCHLSDLAITTTNDAASAIEVGNASVRNNISRVYAIGTAAASTTGSGFLLDAGTGVSMGLSIKDCYMLGYKYGIKMIGSNLATDTWTTVDIVNLWLVGRSAGTVAGSAGVYMDANTNGVGTIFRGGTIESFAIGVEHISGGFGGTFEADFEGNTANYSVGASFNGKIIVPIAENYFRQGTNAAANKWMQEMHLNGQFTRDTYYSQRHGIGSLGGSGEESFSVYYGASVTDGSYAGLVGGFYARTGSPTLPYHLYAMVGQQKIAWGLAGPDGGGSWRIGDIINNSAYAVSGITAWICNRSGTFSSATDSTGDTDGSTAVITGMTDTSDFAAGNYVDVSAGFPTTGPYRVVSLTATTMTLDTNSNSAQSNITVDTSDPTFINPLTSPTAIGGTTPNTGAFTTLTATTLTATTGYIGTSTIAVKDSVNPKGMSQAVNITAGGTASIIKTDSDQIDFGVGNVSIGGNFSLPDWTPAANQILIQKLTGGVGYQLEVVATTGVIRLTLNATAYNSSVGPTITDGTYHKIFTVVTVGAVNTLVDFYMDGIALGTQQTAANPGTLSSAADLYILGASAARYSGIVSEIYLFNRALSAAEVLDLYRNGPAFADKWGSQTAKYSTDFSSGTGWTLQGGWAISAGTLNNDGTSGAHYALRESGTVDFKKYRLTYTVSDYSSGSFQFSLGYQMNLGATQSGNGTYREEITVNTAHNANVYILSNSFIGKIDDLSITEIGATIALKPEGIQADKWIDSSTNQLDASYPTTGYSFTRPFYKELDFVDPDVVHGMTTIASTNSFGHIAPISGTIGGLDIYGLTDLTQDGALRLTGIIGAANPTDTHAAIHLRGGIVNGTGWTDLAASETVLKLSNHEADLITILGDGRTGFMTSAPDKAVEINLGTSDALRLSYNAPSGSATNYVDFTVSSTGSLSMTVAGTNPDIILTPSGSGAVKPGVLAIAEKTPVNAVAAQGTITMSGISVLNETFVVSTQTFTWKIARTGAGEVTIGALASEAVTNIVTAITADLATVTAVDGAGDTVVVTAATKGVSGNSIVFTEASTNMAVDGTGTLGATTAGVDGTLGVANELCADASYLYHAILANTIADSNWRRIALGSAY